MFRRTAIGPVLAWVTLSAVSKFRFVALATVAIAVAACAIESTDLSPIKVGATRAKVERVLGKPVKSRQTDSGKIDTYKYNKGWYPRRSGRSGSGTGNGNVAIFLVLI